LQRFHPLPEEIGVSVFEPGKFGLKRGRAEPAADALVVLLVEGVGEQAAAVDIEHDLQGIPAPDGGEGGLGWDVGISLNCTDGGAVE